MDLSGIDEAGLTPSQREIVLEAVRECLRVVGETVSREPEQAGRYLPVMMIGHYLHVALLSMLVNNASPAVGRKMVQDSARALERALLVERAFLDND
jgi:hypothetical protein